jgi:sulfate transport system substrate-binding protein
MAVLGKKWTWRRGGLELAASLLALAGLALTLSHNLRASTEATLNNVSYDPTRELYHALNPLFEAAYLNQSGRQVTVQQSHGGSSRQSRKVISGELRADVVTLALPSDVNALALRGLVDPKWPERLPNHSTPYNSTIVFVVRGDNPYDIKDWPDLVAPGVEIVTPDPRTSGNGKLAALAAWASVVTRGGGEDAAKTFLKTLYGHVAGELAEGSRGAATAFLQSDAGDVHLTWENEALREVAQSKGRLKIVYPPVSILAEPSVAWVDAALKDPARLADAKAYLSFLYSDAGQQVIARLGYRPLKPESARAAGVSFPDIKLIPITAIARDWGEANQKFFAENGVIDNVLGGLQR